MLSQLIKKEILDSLLNRRFMALAVFSVVLMPLSGYINYEYYLARRASFDSQLAHFQEERRPSEIRTYRPPELLSVLAQGTEPYMPLYYELGTQTNDVGRTTPGNIEAQDFRLLSTLGRFDYLFLVQVVFSLLAILLAYDMIAGEKERGTLKAMLSNAVPRDRVLLGKFVGGFSVLALVFLVGFLLMYLVLGLFDGRFMAGDAVARVMFVLGISLLFLAGFFSLGLMVSALSHSTRTAIVALLVLWVVLQLVVPKASEMVASVLRPVRAEEAVRVEKAKAVADIEERKRKKAGDVYTDVFKSPNINSRLISGDTPEAERFRAEYKRLAKEAMQERADRLREIDRAFARERAAQRRLASGLSLLSPSAAFGFLTADAAGTGDAAYDHYQDDVSDYYGVLDRTVIGDVLDSQVQVTVGGSSLWTSLGDGPDWESVPAFTPTSLSVERVVTYNAWAFASLAAYLIVPFLLAFVAFLRYDVR